MTAAPRSAGRVRRPAATRDGSADARDREGALLVQPPAGAAPSRLQRTFNGLVREVAGLEEKLRTQADDLERLLARHREKIEKPDRELALAQFALARALADAHERIGLRGNQKQDLAATICELCEDAFLSVEPDAETEALYDAWSDRSYRDAMDRSAARGLGDEDFGPDTSDEDDAAGSAAEGGGGEDPQDTSGDTDDRSWHGGSGRERGADFAAREARRREQEELSRRSVREVYLALARVLHPDAVADAAERDVRGEAMKQATGAYREGDLLALLRLELRWIRSPGSRRESPGDETLRAWIRALREQVERLGETLAAQAADPRYDAIAGLAVLPHKKALAEIDARARQLRAATAELVDLRAHVHGCESKRELAAVVRGARRHRRS